MMASCATGILLGALAWAAASLLSGRFEPYDSGLGFAITQIVLCPPAFHTGMKQGMTRAIALVAGSYTGLNLYAYALGGSEARAWALLGAISALLLVALPLLAGVLGKLANRLVPTKSR